MENNENASVNKQLYINSCYKNVMIVIKIKGWY